MYTMHLTKPRNSVGKKEVAYMTLHGICTEMIIPQNKWVITVLTYLKPLSIPSLYELLCSFLGQNCLNCSKTAFKEIVHLDTSCFMQLSAIKQLANATCITLSSGNLTQNDSSQVSNQWPEFSTVIQCKAKNN